MADFYIKQHDTLPPLVRTLEDADGPIDLTGAAVRLHLGIAGVPTTHLDAACVIVDAVAGRVLYAWMVGDTAIAGLYRAEFAVIFDDGSVLTVPNDGYLEIEIAEDLG